ncbi:MAG TPA: LLM class flavin-dependent oxidoreductase [Pseudonocardiaceae bacterium]|nr:LLM class flavin-dependent oxidoreductase [Pseudonocardiaceae bacterium]
MTPRLSVLDQSPVVEGGTPVDALRATVRLAAEVDQLGYTRYWLAEHHASPGFASTAPEVLAGVVLANTRHLRVGSRGVLLSRYPPAKVVETFALLSAIYPGRVDLGIGRTGGPAQDFPRKVAAVLTGLDVPVPPQVWLLGSGTSSAELAAELGTAYCHAHCLNPLSTQDALVAARLSDAAKAVAVRVFVADTEAEASSLARGFLLWRSRKDLGDDQPLPAPDTVSEHRWSPAESARADVHLPSVVYGAPEQVRDTLVTLAARHGVDEIVVNTLIHDEAARLRSYRLLAEACTPSRVP